MNAAKHPVLETPLRNVPDRAEPLGASPDPVLVPRWGTCGAASCHCVFVLNFALSFLPKTKKCKLHNQVNQVFFFL